MKDERDAIQVKSLPNLRQFCSEHGLQLQLVDLNCGIKAFQSMTINRKLKLSEIKECQRLSLGPNFVVIF